MPIVHQVLVDVFHVLGRGLEERSPQSPDPTSTVQQQTLASSSTVPASSPTMTSSSGSGGPTSSPLLFFVALGFGVVFTNLWIIVGVKYCFRYNARNRAIRNGEDVDPINLENMPTRPHRRRREKKLMTMDEVNERFPLTKYKNWVASRAREGLPTNGGVTAPSSRAASLREVDGIIPPSSPVETKHSINTRPATANSDKETTGRISSGERKSLEANAIEKETVTTSLEEHHKLEEVNTTASTVNKHPTTTSEVEDDDDDDHIHTAVPPELLTNPGDSCAICIDTLEDDDDIRGLTCGHAFHAGCLDPWLTSRRACCPLCKADYFTPKPRPEGEAMETGRRRERADGQHGPASVPPASHATWSSIRAPRLIRFGGSAPVDQNEVGIARRVTQRQAAAARANGSGTNNGAAANANTTPTRRWNPLSSFSMPAMRLPSRNRPQAPEQTAQPTPSQMEAGVNR